eukprot:12906888-Prorocentrum_lima.AAC.1
MVLFPSVGRPNGSVPAQCVHSGRLPIGSGRRGKRGVVGPDVCERACGCLPIGFGLSRRDCVRRQRPWV